MNWQLEGPIIPVWVWRSHLKRAVGFQNGAILWRPMEARDWRDFDADRLPDDAHTLVLVHGTGLRTEPGFRGLSREDYWRLRGLYGDRILAFEHKALANSVDRNARDLVRGLVAGGVHLKLDLVGLSRGGLIARRVTEGWVDDEPGIERLELRKLIFVGTPNGGTPSARRDPIGRGWREMKAWRTDVRRLTLVNVRDREVETVEDPHSLPGFVPGEKGRLGLWPMLLGTQDQLPMSAVLQELNGFVRPTPGRVRSIRYFGIASVFTFEHGAPNKQLLPDRCRRQITDWALGAAPNDLVVPTRSVFAPLQGEHASGLFPLVKEQLMVLGPRSNATHTSLMLTAGVRRRIVDWLAD